MVLNSRIGKQTQKYTLCLTCHLCVVSCPKQEGIVRKSVKYTRIPEIMKKNYVNHGESPFPPPRPTKNSTEKGAAAHVTTFRYIFPTS